MIFNTDESAAYVALLTELSEEREVESYWDEGGTPADGVELVQIAAPGHHHASIRETLLSSGLHVAHAPVRFLEQ